MFARRYSPLFFFVRCVYRALEKPACSEWRALLGFLAADPRRSIALRQDRGCIFEDGATSETPAF